MRVVTYVVLDDFRGEFPPHGDGEPAAHEPLLPHPAGQLRHRLPLRRTQQIGEQFPVPDLIRPEQFALLDAVQVSGGPQRLRDLRQHALGPDLAKYSF